MSSQMLRHYASGSQLWAVVSLSEQVSDRQGDVCGRCYCIHMQRDKSHVRPVVSTLELYPDVHPDRCSFFLPPTDAPMTCLKN